jgi:hypothetical protein
MQHSYPGVITRHLRPDERFIQSDEQEMPLVIEADQTKDLNFLHQFLQTHSSKILADIARYGAVLLRGFTITKEADFQSTILSIDGLRGIEHAFMAEEGRVAVDKQKYVLHTNAVYKTGGTLYLGGFHSENYYSTDVPFYICFWCKQPSAIGGETGLINMRKVYAHMPDTLKKKLEQQNFYAGKWRIDEISERYHLCDQTIEKIAASFKIPIIGKGKNRFLLMFKPNVFIHPYTDSQALQINFFEIAGLNEALRECFMQDYAGKTWFWHRLIWRLPRWLLMCIERAYIIMASFLYSPRGSFNVFFNKIRSMVAAMRHGNRSILRAQTQRVGSCFTQQDVAELAQRMRQYYCSCLWKPGDVLLVDNLQVVHAGMPGAGQRTLRAMICNPLEMDYAYGQSGVLSCKERQIDTVGKHMVDK